MRDPSLARHASLVNGDKTVWEKWVLRKCAIYLLNKVDITKYFSMINHFTNNGTLFLIQQKYKKYISEKADG